ncbi:MAG: tRNA epoxyqueuosine(34) reductase QueG, partial [Ketobacteraceae bacterium]|nr:tRNA epoxyqueuosine(34) reductase QueG [Ketobacteraceae bacterium]
HGLERNDLLSLFQWDEETFLKNTEGSAIRRIGYQRWLRNLAVGLGNAPYREAIIEALQQKLPEAGDLAAEHIHWAIEQQRQRIAR